jgi:predicted RNA-binding Zn ribbon-like protein
MDTINSTSFSPFGDAPLIGDHPAIDLINTVSMKGDALIDFWQTDDDVFRWLDRTNLLQKEIIPRFKQFELLTTARTLREIVRTLVIQEKEGRGGDLSQINDFLAQGHSYLELLKDASSKIQMVRRYGQKNPVQLLTPLAESAAELLSTGDLDLVRPCKGDKCVLWFYDRTKSHQRRWCSMSVCGNRHKVMAFRQRQQ